MAVITTPSGGKQTVRTDPKNPFNIPPSSPNYPKDKFALPTDGGKSGGGIWVLFWRFGGLENGKTVY